MGIYILEDNINQRLFLEEMIRELCEEHAIEVSQIISTQRPEVILEEISKSNEYNIYFLDIEIKKAQIKGLDVSKEIRNIDEKGEIVFVTSYPDLAPVSYKYMVRALNFIEKNLDMTEFKQNILDCLLHYKQGLTRGEEKEYFHYTSRSSDIHVIMDKIYYFEITAPHRILLQSDNKQMQFYGDLTSIEKESDSLFRCHQSYVVNINKIVELDKTARKITLENGETLPISKRSGKSLMQAWIEKK